MKYVFQRFKATIENQYESLIILRFDNNDTEFISNKFKDFHQKVGIHHQLTVTYIPQQNGVWGRKNRSIMNMTQCLLFEKGLPKVLWAESVNTIVYLQNRLPTRSVEGAMG